MIMKNLQCPNCQQNLSSQQVRLKLTKDKKAYKARCGLCHHAWKFPNNELDPEPTPEPEGLPVSLL